MSFGEVTDEQRAEAERHGLTIYSWDQFLKLVRVNYNFILILLLYH